MTATPNDRIADARAGYTNARDQYREGIAQLKTGDVRIGIAMVTLATQMMRVTAQEMNCYVAEGKVDPDERSTWRERYSAARSLEFTAESLSRSFELLTT